MCFSADKCIKLINNKKKKEVPKSFLAHILTGKRCMRNSPISVYTDGGKETTNEQQHVLGTVQQHSEVSQGHTPPSED